MRHVCEICCDLSVANILREKTSKYRDSLLRTARELFVDHMEPSFGFLGIFEEPFRLVPRLKWLEKKTWENRKLRIVASICISLFMMTCVMPMAGLSQSGTQENKEIQFVRPMTGWISSGYGYRISPFTDEKEFHNGIDIAARSGEPIHAAASGIVNKVEFTKIRGHQITLQHSNNYQTLYAQCEKILVKEGQSVKSGDIIATCGSSGRSTGPHLHFELRKDGKTIDPVEIYPESAKLVKGFDDSELKSAGDGSSISAVVDRASMLLMLKQTNDYVADLKNRIDETNKQIKHYEAKVEDTPKRAQELLALNRDYEKLMTLYNSLLSRKLEAELAISMEKKQAEGSLAETEKKRGTLPFLTDELKAAEKSLKEKEKEIKDYREKNMGGLPEQLQTNLSILNNLQIQAESLINGLKDLEMKREALLRKITASTGPKGIDDIVTYSKKQLSILESRYSSMHPDVIRLKKVIEGLEASE
jgi:septal ring factor EnvC (AmiA/AmiB activator)